MPLGRYHKQGAGEVSPGQDIKITDRSRMVMVDALPGLKALLATGGLCRHAPVVRNEDAVDLRGDIRLLSNANPFERIEMIRHGVPAVLVASMATMMKRSRADLLRMLQVPTSTYERKRIQNGSLDAAESERVLGFLSIVTEVESLVAGSEHADDFDAYQWVGEWIEQPCPALGNRAPKDLLDTSEGVALVSKAIGQSASGAYA